jgi:hypothetical protein
MSNPEEVWGKFAEEGRCLDPRRMSLPSTIDQTSEIEATAAGFEV